MITDRIGDFIIRLQNAAKVGKPRITVPYSAHLMAIAKKLKELGYVSEIIVDPKGVDGVHKDLDIALSYDPQGRPRLRGVKRISKPGRRLYAASTEAHTVKGGTGARLLSTSQGVLSDKEARKAGVGGENLFEIW